MAVVVQELHQDKISIAGQTGTETMFHSRCPPLQEEVTHTVIFSTTVVVTVEMSATKRSSGLGSSNNSTGIDSRAQPCRPGEHLDRLWGAIKLSSNNSSSSKGKALPPSPPNTTAVTRVQLTTRITLTSRHLDAKMYRHHGTTTTTTTLKASSNTNSNSISNSNNSSSRRREVVASAPWGMIVAEPAVLLVVVTASTTMAVLTVLVDSRLLAMQLVLPALGPPAEALSSSSIRINSNKSCRQEPTAITVQAKVPLKVGTEDVVWLLTATAVVVAMAVS